MIQHALLTAADLTETELSAAVLDGELYRVGEGFRPIDLPLDAAARAASLREILVHARVAAGPTAAWIWGAGDDPGTPYPVIVPRDSSVAHPSGVGSFLVTTRVMRLTPGEIIPLGGVPVTSALRTAMDLLCDEAWDYSPGVIDELVRLAGADVATLAAELRARSRLVGRGRALARLQVLVTR